MSRVIKSTNTIVVLLMIFSYLSPACAGDTEKERSIRFAEYGLNTEYCLERFGGGELNRISYNLEELYDLRAEFSENEMENLYKTDEELGLEYCFRGAAITLIDCMENCALRLPYALIRAEGESGGPVSVDDTFEAVEGEYILTAVNGVSGAYRADRTVITVNGENVEPPGLPDPDADKIEAEVNLVDGENTITVELKGNPGKSLFSRL